MTDWENYSNECKLFLEKIVQTSNVTWAIKIVLFCFFLRQTIKMQSINGKYIIQLERKLNIPKIFNSWIYESIVAKQPWNS